jgi:hypothetical protein
VKDQRGMIPKLPIFGIKIAVSKYVIYDSADSVRGIIQLVTTLL